MLGVSIDVEYQCKNSITLYIYGKIVFDLYLNNCFVMCRSQINVQCKLMVEFYVELDVVGQPRPFYTKMVEDVHNYEDISREI